MSAEHTKQFDEKISDKKCKCLSFYKFPTRMLRVLT